MKARSAAVAVGIVIVLAMPLGVGGDLGVTPLDVVERYIPRPAGVEKDMSFFFGPFVIPPGQDMNRVTLDVPLHGGFFTSIAPNLVDATTGEEPSDLEMHIHHAHWFRVSDDPSDEYYTLNLAWIFGTGEEKTQGSLNARSAAEPGGPRYGIFIPGGQPQVLIYMLHNKVATAKTLYVTLDVTFVYGTADEVHAATDCGVLEPGERCSAGEDFHPLKGRLWGTTFDVPRQANGDGLYVHPIDIPAGHPTRRATDHLGRFFEAPASGVAIATAGHMHPNGHEVVVANLGPAGSACAADLDGDGFPGVTLLRSKKLEREPAAAPYSEDYQMAASQFGWRAPVRQGDRITQFGVYQNDLSPAYEAMSYTGIYVDRLQPPAPRGTEGCTLANTRPYLVDDPAGDATEGMLNHAWTHQEPLCGLAGWPACDRPWDPRAVGLDTPVVKISAFAYVPGDLNFDGMLGAPPRVKQGQPLRFINDDVGLAIRHTVTSCAFPCNGPYVANYPLPDGSFDSGKLGNLDYIDGGITGDDTVPYWDTPTTLAQGLYTYYCRIHPGMRGAFEVV